MKYFVRGVLGLVVALITAMWVYGLFFASRQAVNKFDDQAWVQKAQARCLIAEQQRIALADYRIVDDLGSDATVKRAEIIDSATDTIESFVVEFRANLPRDAKGKAIVGLWLDDYEIYIADRRSFADDLRSGVNLQFSETPVDGLPLSEKIATFAAENEITNCKPPLDLSI